MQTRTALSTMQTYSSGFQHFPGAPPNNVRTASVLDDDRPWLGSSPADTWEQADVRQRVTLLSRKRILLSWSALWRHKMRASKVEAILADGSLLLRDAHPCSKKMDSSVTGILSSATDAKCPRKTRVRVADFTNQEVGINTDHRCSTFQPSQKSRYARRLCAIALVTMSDDVQWCRA